MTTKTDFHSIKELKEKYTPVQRGIVSADEANIIREVLELGQRNDVELQNIRDVAVMLYSRWADTQREKQYSCINGAYGCYECCMCCHRQGKDQTWDSVLKMEKAKRKCVHCKHLERHKRKDSIGICYQYNVLVLDSLCGCVRQEDGTIKLLNFQLNNEEKGCDES